MRALIEVKKVTCPSYRLQVLKPRGETSEQGLD